MNGIKFNPQNNYHNYKGKKRSLPISINSNILPCQFLFSKPTSKVATSYINIGQKIQKQNHQKTKSNLSNNVLINPYILMNNHSKYSNNSLLKKNQNLTSITNYNIKRDNSNSLSHRDTYYHSRKKNTIYSKKSRQDSSVNSLNIPKHLTFKNSSLIASKPIKKGTIKNFQFKQNANYSNIVNRSNNFNNDKNNNNKNKRYITLNAINKKNKSVNSYLPQNRRMLSHENINIPVNKKFGKDNKNINKDNKNLSKDNKEKNIKNNKVKHRHSVSKDNMNNLIKNNSVKNSKNEIKKIHIIHYNKKNKVPKAETKNNSNKIIKEIKILTEQKELSKNSNSKKNINEVKLSIDDNIDNKLKIENKKKITISEPNLSSKSIFNEKEENKRKINNEFNNELFNEENLNELPIDLDDKFDDLNAIVRKIKFNLVIVNKESLFSQNSKTYKNYKKSFDNDYEKNNSNKLKNIFLSLDKDKNKITERKNYINLSFSTQSGSSNKKAFQNPNNLISPITNKFDLNI